MKNKKDITILIPLHKYEGLYVEMLENVISSIEPFKDKVIINIITSKELSEKINTNIEGYEINVVINEGDLKYQTQINKGIESVKTNWFSIIEVDDEFHSIWYDMFKLYSSKNKDCGVFLGITEDVTPKGELSSLTNESVWAYGISDEFGILSKEALKKYQHYQLSGGIFKTKDVKKIGKFYNEDIELTFQLETIHRLQENDVRIMVIPKVLYRHVVGREDSLFWLYKNDKNYKLTEEQSVGWMKEVFKPEEKKSNLKLVE